MRQVLADDERRRKIDAIADEGLRGLYQYVKKLSDRYEFDAPIGAVVEDVRLAVRMTLLTTLTGGETQQEALKAMRCAVRKRFEVAG